MEKLYENDFQTVYEPEWLLSDKKGKPVCSFIPAVIKVTNGSNTSESPKFVTLRLTFKDGDYLETKVDYDEIETLKWSKIDSRCIINSNYRGAGNYIANIIQASMAKAPLEKKSFLSHLGINRIGENIVFFAGDRVIIPSPTKTDETNYIWRKGSFHLDID